MLVLTGMGFEGPLVLASFVTITPVHLDVRTMREHLPRLDDRALVERPRLDRVLVEPRLALADRPPSDVSADLRLDFSLAITDLEPPAKLIELESIELRDATAAGDWARQVDFELCATRGRWSVAANHHFIVRNIGEAQGVVSFAIEY